MTTFNFEVESKTKGQKAKSDNLKTINVPFIFSRYGMEYKGDKAKSSHIPRLGCNIPNFDYKVSPLKKDGYLYVYYEKRGREILPQGQLYEEYQVSLRGNKIAPKASYILLSKSGEDIPLANRSSIDIFDFDTNSIIWVAFSEIKINKNRQKEIFMDNDQLKVRFQKIDVKYWTDHHPLNGKNRLVKTLSAADPDDINYTIQCTIDDVSNTKVYSFALNDAISAAEDIEEYLSQIHLEFQSLVASLGTSLSKNEVYTRTINGSSDTISKPGEDQYASLFQSAVLLNNIFFSKDALKNKDLNKYRGLINQNRINAVLGRSEVLTLKLKIRGQGNSPIHAGLPKKYQFGLRDSLGMMMQSSYLNDVLSDATNSGREGVALYKNVSSILAHTLSRMPESISHVMNLEPFDLEKLENNDKWIQYIKATYPNEVIQFGKIRLKYGSGENVIQKLFEIQLDIPWNQSTDANVYDWFVNNYAAIYSTISSIEMTAAIYLTLKTYSSKYNEVAARLISDKQAILSVLGKIDLQDMKASEYADYMMNNSQGKNIKHTMIPHTTVPYGTRKHVEDLVKQRTQKVNTHAAKNEAVYAELKIFKLDKIDKVLSSPLFAKIMIGLSSFNLLVSTYDFMKHPNLASAIRIGGDTAGVVALYTALPKFRSYYMVVSRNLAREMESILKLRAGRLTLLVSKGITIPVAASAIFTLVVSYFSAKDGWDMYNRNNEEAGVWGMISGAAGFGMTVAYIVTFFTTMIVFGIIALILLVITILATILQLVKIKDYLEVYLECIVFQNKEYKLLGASGDSYSVKHELCKPKTLDKLTKVYKMKENNPGDKQLDMSDHNKMFEWLLNLVIGFSLTNKFTYSQYTENKDLVDHNDKKTYRYPSRISFDIQFQYFPPFTKLEAYLLFYPMGSDQNVVRNLLDTENLNDKVVMNDGGINSDFRFKINLETDIGTYIRNVHSGQAKWIPGKDVNENLPAALFSKTACYILQIRFTPLLEGIPGTYYPFKKNGQDVYIAYSETLLFDISKATAYNTLSKYNGYYAKLHKKDRPRYYIDDSSVFVGTVKEIRKWAKPAVVLPSSTGRFIKKVGEFGGRILKAIKSK